jgi:hypothetical protein
MFDVTHLESLVVGDPSAVDLVERRRIVTAAEKHDGELDAEQRVEGSVRDICYLDLYGEARIEAPAADLDRLAKLGRTTAVEGRHPVLTDRFQQPFAVEGGDEVAGTAFVELRCRRRERKQAGEAGAPFVAVVVEEL